MPGTEYPDLTEGEKNRINLAFQRILEKHDSNRMSDLQQAQDLINKALNYTGYTLAAMIALPSAHDYIAIAGLFLILNLALGTLNKYKSRRKTQLRERILGRWHVSGMYHEMQSYNCCSEDILIEKVSLRALIYSKFSIAFNYIAMFALISLCALYDVPLLVKAKAAAISALPAVKAVIGA